MSYNSNRFRPDGTAVYQPRESQWSTHNLAARDAQRVAQADRTHKRRASDAQDKAAAAAAWRARWAAEQATPEAQARKAATAANVDALIAGMAAPRRSRPVTVST